MEKFTDIINKFVNKMGYLKNANLEGIVWYGSSQTGFANSCSDIDLHIVFSDLTNEVRGSDYQPPCTESTGFAWMTESHTMLKHTVLHKNIITNFFLICYIFLDNILCYGSYASTKISSRPHMLPPILSS